MPNPEPAAVRTTEAFFATRPTRWTVFLRTFIPWQIVRFVVINLKMLRMIRISHAAHPPGHGDRDGPADAGAALRR
jgi:hypothetical protein